MVAIILPPGNLSILRTAVSDPAVTFSASDGEKVAKDG
jgi:hypothetical protein